MSEPISEEQWKELEYPAQHSDTWHAILDLHHRVKSLEGDKNELPETAALLRELEEAGKLFREIVDLGMNQTRYHNILKWLRKRAESWDKPASEEAR